MPGCSDSRRDIYPFIPSHSFHRYSLCISILFILPVCPVITAFDFNINLGEVWESVSSASTKITSSACSVLGIECCRAPSVRPWEDAISLLKQNLKEEFFGQHLAAETVTHSLEAHLKDESGSKALVLSFHGWAGSGKTFLSEQIMKAMYSKGYDSNFVKFYMASFHFPDPEKVQEYQDLLRKDIIATVKKCERSLFVFDEVDKTPVGVFDALVPFIQYPGNRLEGLNFKRSVFIFISNNGANDVTRITLQAWQDGRNREDLTFSDFEKYLSKEAFNKKGNGLYRSRIIDKILVDFYIPFLPMQREHVISCAVMEGKRMNQTIDAEKIADGLAYWPPIEKLYSQTGCKKVEALVKYYLAVDEMKKNMNQDDEDEPSNSKEEL